jgi:hypothetical protein
VLCACHFRAVSEDLVSMLEANTVLLQPSSVLI